MQVLYSEYHLAKQSIAELSEAKQSEVTSKQSLAKLSGAL
jgi:hypothetical protein